MSEGEQKDDKKTEGTNVASEAELSLGSPDLTLEDLEAEANAEEEFISAKEDQIENPLVYGEDNKLHLESQLQESEVEKKKETLPGAIGTGDFETEGLPFNNEQALREEKMNENNNPSKNDENNPDQENPNINFDSNDIEINANDSTTEVSAEVSTDTPDDQINTELAAEMDAMLNEAGAEPIMNMGAEVTDAPREEVKGEVIAPAGEAAPTTDTVAVDTTATPTVADLAANANNAAPAADAKPKKKKKTGLIIGLSAVAVLLIGGGVGAVCYLNWHESPEKMFADALEQAWNAKNVQSETSVTVKSSDEDGKNEQSVNFKLSTIAAENAASMSIKELTIHTEELGDVTFTVDAAYSLDDAYYFKVGGLKSIVDNQLKKLADEAKDEEEDEDASIDEIFNMIGDAVEVIDDKWIKMDADSFEAFGIKKQYDCFNEKAKSLSTDDFKKKVADIYGENAFMSLADEEATKKDDLNYYKIKIDEGKAEAFSKKVGELDEVKALSTCFDSDSKTDDDDDLDLDDDFNFDLDEDDLKKDDENKPEYEILVGISGWSHEFKAVKVTVKEDTKYSKSTVEAESKLSYENKSVDLPGDAKSVKDLVNDLKDVLINIALKQAETQVSTMCEYMYTTKDEIKQCTDEMMKDGKKELEESFKDLDLSDIDVSDLMTMM